MDESNKKELNVDHRDDLLSDRRADATSDEVVSDLPDTTNTGKDNDPGPSPDGALDETDETKDAGPM
jgi:hypothetical protein